MSDVRVQRDWWLASDGRWYPPELHPNIRPVSPSSLPPAEDQYGINPVGSPKLVRESSPGGPPVWQRGADNNRFRYPRQGDLGPMVGASAQGISTPTSGRRRRGTRVLLGGLALILLVGLALGIHALTNSGSKTSAACALLTSSQESELLDHPSNVRNEGESLHTTQGASVRGATLCTVIPWPITSQRSFTSLFLVMRPAPVNFPSALDRRLGQPIEVDGQTAWWIPSDSTLMSRGSLPGSDYFLVATKDGWLLSVQVTNIHDSKSIAISTMSDSLRSI